MAQMVVRNIDECVHRGLKDLAARNGVSLEEQVRRVLTAAARAAAQPRRTAGEALDEVRRRHRVRLRPDEVVKLRGGVRPADFGG